MAAALRGRSQRARSRCRAAPLLDNDPWGCRRCRGVARRAGMRVGPAMPAASGGLNGFPEQRLPTGCGGFVSSGLRRAAAEGGFDGAKVCVITAKAMMLPRSAAHRPAKTAPGRRRDHRGGRQRAAVMSYCGKVFARCKRRSMTKHPPNKGAGATLSANCPPPSFRGSSGSRRSDRPCVCLLQQSDTNGLRALASAHNAGHPAPAPSRRFG